MEYLHAARRLITGGHTWRVAQYSRMLTEEAGLSNPEIFLSGLGEFVHDIGKVGIPDRVLNKAGHLKEDEFSLLNTHPSVGKNVLASHPLGPLVSDAVTYHHERYDGKGIYRLHVTGTTFELEPTRKQRFDRQPEIDLEQIDDFASGAPKK